MTACADTFGKDMPDGACDCAIHVYETGYPIASTATFEPPVAPVESYLLESAILGLRRVVIAQPSAYGFDNRCTLAAIKSLGESARGLAVVPPDASDVDIKTLHDGGMRGIRYMLFPGGALPAELIGRIAAIVAPFNWHINVRLPLATLPKMEAPLKRLPVRTVIDLDLGCYRLSDGCESQGLQSLQRLVDTGRTWVKIAAPYRNWLQENARLAEIHRVPETFIASYPERCLWASNWPHPNVTPRPALETCLNWALDRIPADSRGRILVENPGSLYGF